MTRTFIVTSLMASSLFFGGCGGATVEGSVEVDTPPAEPAPVVEVQTASPGAEFFWVGGYHRWYGGRYVWVGGHWDRRPHANAVWRPARWEVRGRRHVWIEARWE